MSASAIDEVRPTSRPESPEDQQEPRTPPHSPLRSTQKQSDADGPTSPSRPTPMAKDSFVMKTNPKAASPQHSNKKDEFYTSPHPQQRGRSEGKSGAAPKPAAPEGPPMPAEVAKLSKMSARERVKEGLRVMRSLQPTRASANFRSRTERDPYSLNLHPNKTAQQLRKETMEEEWRQSVASRSGSAQGRGRSTERNPNEAPRGSATRSSSWARDTTPRGNFMYNWTAMPQVIPKKYIDPTPGPGQYTPVLHFLGGTH